MGEERVGDVFQPFPGFVVLVGDRLVGDVPAGQDDRVGHGLEEQVVQRGVGQHDAELTVGRCGGGRDGGAGPGLFPARQQHDRPGRAGQQVRGRGVDLGQLPGRGQVGGHDRERLVLAVLARAQRGHRLLAGGVGGQVVAAEALDGEDLAAAEESGGRPERVRAVVVARIEQRQPGTAGRAAGGLGVETAVGGIVVLGRAPLAHLERRHGGQRPVVGHVADDGEPGTAVGAVDERVLVPPVGRVAELAQAVRAGRGVRRHQGAAQPRARVAGGDDEFRRSSWRDGHGGDALDPGQRRRVPLQLAQELADRGGRPLDLGEHPVEVVADQPGQAQAGGQRVHERAEADALHDPLHADRRPDGVHRRITSLSPYLAETYETNY